jgi:2-hydroxychromene-2-carboxylate isomerase
MFDSRALSIWFSYGSTYSYLSVMRIEQLAAEHGVKVQWKPFHVLAIFRDMGLPNGPFKPYPAKISYMWRDLERRAARHGLPYQRPPIYPPKMIRTTCVGLVAAREGWCGPFTRTTFHLHWAEGILIDTEENLCRSIAEQNHDPERVLNASRSEDIRQELNDQTEKARQLGIFGAPSFVVGEELFWGDDRMDEAIEYAARQRSDG